MRRYAILLACLAVVAVQPAGAQESGQGLLNAVAYKPLASGQPIAVRPLDNSDDNLILQEVFEGELKAAGYAVAEDAALVLTFETRNVIGAWVSGERRSMVELDSHGGQEGGENAQVRFNLFNSSRGGVFNQGQQATTSIITPSQYRLDVSIDDRTSGKRLWQGWTIAGLGQSDGLTLTRGMVPVMVKNLGRTVRRQPFDIP